MDNSIIHPDSIYEDSFLFKPPKNSAFDATVDETLPATMRTFRSSCSLDDFELDEQVVEVLEDVIHNVERIVSSPPIPEDETVFRVPPLPSVDPSKRTVFKVNRPVDMSYSRIILPDENQCLYDDDEESEYNFTSKRAMNESIMSVDDPNLISSKKICADELTFVNDYSLYQETFNASNAGNSQNSTMDLTLLRAFTGPDSQELANVLTEKNCSYSSNKDINVSCSFSEMFNLTVEDKENSLIVENEASKKTNSFPKSEKSPCKHVPEETISFNLTDLNASLDESLKERGEADGQDDIQQSGNLSANTARVDPSVQEDVIVDDEKPILNESSHKESIPTSDLKPNITNDSWAGLDASGVNTLSTTLMSNQSSSFCISINNQFDALDEMIDEESFDADLRDHDQDLVFCNEPTEAAADVLPSESFSNISIKPTVTEEKIVLVDKVDPIMFQQERYELLLRIDELEQKLKEKQELSAALEESHSPSSPEDSDLRAIIKVLEDDLSKTISEKNIQAELVKDLECKLEDIQKNYSSVQDDKNDLSQRIEELVVQNNALDEQLKNGIQELHRQKELYESSSDILAEERSEFERLKLAFESQISSLKAQLSDADAYKAEQAELETKFEKEKQEFEQLKLHLEFQIDSLANELSNANAVKVDVVTQLESKLEQEKQEYEKLKVDYESQITSLTEQLSNAVAGQANQADILVQLQSKFDHEKEEFKQLQTDLEHRIDSLSNELLDVNSEKSKQADIANELQNKYQDAQDRLSMVQEKMNGLFERIKALTDNNDSLNERLRDTLEEYENYKETSEANLNKRMDELKLEFESRIEQLQADKNSQVDLANNLEDKLNHIQASYSAVQEEKDDLSQRVQELINQNSSLEEQLRVVVQENNNQTELYQTSVKRFEEEKHEFEQLKNDLDSRISSLSTELLNANCEKEKQVENFSKLESEFEQAKQEFEQLRTDLETQISSLSNELTDANSEKKEQADIAQELETKYKDVQSRLSIVQEEMNDMSEQVKTMTSNNDLIKEQLKNTLEEYESYKQTFETNSSKLMEELKLSYEGRIEQLQMEKGHQIGLVEDFKEKVNIIQKENEQLTQYGQELVEKGRLLEQQLQQVSQDRDHQIELYETSSNKFERLRLDLEAKICALTAELNANQERFSEEINLKDLQINSLIEESKMFYKFREVDLESLLRLRETKVCFLEKFQENQLVVKKLSAEIESLIGKIRTNADFAAKLNPKSVGRMLGIMGDKLNKLSFPEDRIN